MENKNKKQRCLHCKKVIQKNGNNFFPFCSNRCKDVDLGKWFFEEFTIPCEMTDEVSNQGAEEVK